MARDSGLVQEEEAMMFKVIDLPLSDQFAVVATRDPAKERRVHLWSRTGAAQRYLRRLKKKNANRRRRGLLEEGVERT